VPSVTQVVARADKDISSTKPLSPLFAIQESGNEEGMQKISPLTEL
jgi:hypothetical protein